MERNIMEVFIKAGKEIVAELLNEEALPKEMIIVEETIKVQDLIVIIGMAGELEGRVILEISPETAWKISEIFLQEKIDVNASELIESAVGEIGNMIVGRAVSMLNEMGYSIKITPPTLFRGNNLVTVDKKSKILVSPISTSIGDFFINLSIKKLRRIEKINYKNIKIKKEGKI